MHISPNVQEKVADAWNRQNNHFKEMVLSHFPSAQEQIDGKNVILVFEQGIQQMLKTSIATDHPSRRHLDYSDTNCP